MFRKTSIAFKLSYFITAMFPSIILFTLKNLLENSDYGINVKILITLSIGMFICILAFSFIKTIKRNYLKHKYLEQDQYQQSDFSRDKISVFNGDPVSFLISNVSTIYVISEFMGMSIIAYFFLLFSLYLMMTNSKNIQPNLFFILAGIDIIKTKDNDFLIVLNNDKDSHNNILKFTKSKVNSLYIVGKINN